MTQPISRTTPAVIPYVDRMQDEETPGLPDSFNFNDFVNVIDEVEQDDIRDAGEQALYRATHDSNYQEQAQLDKVEQEDIRDAQEQYFYQLSHPSNDLELTQADADMPPKEYVSESDDSHMKQVDRDAVMAQRVPSAYEMLQTWPSRMPEEDDAQMTPEQRAAQERLHISYERTGTEASSSTVRLVVDFAKNLLGS
jgi:hypothetical protein